MASQTTREKILLVDDNQDELRALVQVLSEKHFHVLGLSRPLAAPPLCASFGPQAVVIAASKAESEGMILARRLKAEFKGALPTFLLLEGENRELRHHCLKKGLAAATFAKPVDSEELALHLRAQLGLLNAVRAEAESHLSGRAALLPLLGHEMQRCERYGGSFCLLGFVLRPSETAEETQAELEALAHVLAELGRDADVMARVGERHLAVFLPQTSLDQLPAFLARVVRRLHDPSRTRKGLGQKVAVGLCAFPEARGTAEQLLERCVRGPRPSVEYLQLSHPLSPRRAELM